MPTSHSTPDPSNSAPGEAVPPIGSLPSLPTPELLAVEYQAAQNSAQHHDILALGLTSVVWSVTLIMMVGVMANVGRPAARIPISAICIIGALLDFAAWRAMLHYNSLKRQKYCRCKEIEAILNFWQHRNVIWPAGSHRWAYKSITFVLLVAWVVMAMVAWTQ